MPFWSNCFHHSNSLIVPSDIFTSSLEPASYVTQNSSSKLFIPLSETFIWTCRFNLLHTAVTFRHFFTVSLWAQNLPFQEILAVKRAQISATKEPANLILQNGKRPDGDGLTPSLMVMLAYAKFWSFYCKTWFSAYSKLLPPAAFWQLILHLSQFLSVGLISWL